MADIISAIDIFCNSSSIDDPSAKFYIGVHFLLLKSSKDQLSPRSSLIDDATKYVIMTCLIVFISTSIPNTMVFDVLSYKTELLSLPNCLANPRFHRNSRVGTRRHWTHACVPHYKRKSRSHYCWQSVSLPTSMWTRRKLSPRV
jgi:hypothetical protein